MEVWCGVVWVGGCAGGSGGGGAVSMQGRVAAGGSARRSGRLGRHSRWQIKWRGADASGGNGIKWRQWKNGSKSRQLVQRGSGSSMGAAAGGALPARGWARMMSTRAASAARSPPRPSRSAAPCPPEQIPPAEHRCHPRRPTPTQEEGQAGGCVEGGALGRRTQGGRAPQRGCTGTGGAARRPRRQGAGRASQRLVATGSTSFPASPLSSFPEQGPHLGLALEAAGCLLVVGLGLAHRLVGARPRRLASLGLLALVAAASHCASGGTEGGGGATGGSTAAKASTDVGEACPSAHSCGASTSLRMLVSKV